MFYFSKKVRLFSQNGGLFLFYFLINPTMTTEYLNFTIIHTVRCIKNGSDNFLVCSGHGCNFLPTT